MAAYTGENEEEGEEEKEEEALRVKKKNCQGRERVTDSVKQE